MSGKKIYVGNVADSARRKDLQELFEKHGIVTECDIVRDFAFVHFESSEAALAAVEALDGYSYLGQKLQVEMSKSRGRGAPRGRLPLRDTRPFRGPPRYRSPPRHRSPLRYRSPPRYHSPPSDYYRRPPSPRGYSYTSQYSAASYRDQYATAYRSRSPYQREAPPPRYASPPRVSDYDRYGPSASRYGRLPPPRSFH